MAPLRDKAGAFQAELFREYHFQVALLSEAPSMKRSGIKIVAVKCDELDPMGTRGPGMLFLKARVL